LTRDEDATAYKRKPVLTGRERVLSAQNCKWVDEVLYEDAPFAITKEFLDKYQIDIVAHGDDFDKEKLRKFYGVAMDLGIFKIVPYTQGISTTEILKRIKEFIDAQALAPPKPQTITTQNQQPNPTAKNEVPTTAVTTTSNSNEKKEIRVYVDMVGDMWHFGHANFCKQAKSFGTYLIVGLNKDEDCIGYKRKPILKGDERVRSAQSCKWVDEVLYDDVPLSVTKEFIDKHRIDIVAHGDDFDKEKVRQWYGVAMDLGIFRTVPYTSGVSTTELINRIKSYYFPEQQPQQQSQNKN